MEALEVVTQNEMTPRKGRSDLTSASPCVVASRDESPPYIRREYIERGYLLGGSHLETAKKTLFTATNETLNAWTMVFAILVCLGLYVRAVSQAPSLQQLVPLTVFYASAFLHLPFAVCCSCFLGMSERAKEVWRQRDVFFIFTSGTLRGLALGWVVFQRWAPLYYLPLLGTYAHCISSVMRRRQLKNIPRQELVKDISLICLTYTFPLAWQAGAELLGLGAPGWLALRAYVGLIACLGVSAYICSVHVPERWAPGVFDIVGASHQIMHVLVLGEYCCEWGYLLSAVR